MIICIPISKGNFTTMKLNYYVNVNFQVLTLYALTNDVIIGRSCMKGIQELSVLVLQTHVYSTISKYKKVLEKKSMFDAG